MVRGVDIQRVLAQFNQVERLQQELINHPEQNQRLLSIQQHQQSLLRKITVQKSDAADPKKVDPEGDNRNRYRRRRGAHQDPKDEPDAEELVLRQQVGIGAKIDVTS